MTTEQDNDLVARLRLHQIVEGKSFFDIFDEAADEIERLHKQCEGLAQAAMNNGADILKLESEITRLRSQSSPSAVAEDVVERATAIAVKAWRNAHKFFDDSNMEEVIKTLAAAGLLKGAEGSGDDQYQQLRDTVADLVFGKEWSGGRTHDEVIGQLERVVEWSKEAAFKPPVEGSGDTKLREALNNARSWIAIQDIPSTKEQLNLLDQIDEALATPSAPADAAAMREKIARIIDPIMWPTIDEFRRIGAHAMADVNAAPSLAKADAILSIIPLPSPAGASAMGEEQSSNKIKSKGRTLGDIAFGRRS